MLKLCRYTIDDNLVTILSNVGTNTIKTLNTSRFMIFAVYVYRRIAINHYPLFNYFNSLPILCVLFYL